MISLLFICPFIQAVGLFALVAWSIISEKRIDNFRLAALIVTGLMTFVVAFGLISLQMKLAVSTVGRILPALELIAIMAVFTLTILVIVNDSSIKVSGKASELYRRKR